MKPAMKRPKPATKRPKYARLSAEHKKEVKIIINEMIDRAIAMTPANSVERNMAIYAIQDFFDGQVAKLYKDNLKLTEYVA